MKISLDYDKTYTLDKEFWNIFIKTAKLSGHQVYCVTMRSVVYDWHNDFDQLDKLGVPVVWCDGKAKRKVCERMGISIDVWIDDTPEGITEGSSFSPSQLHEWRQTQALN